METWCYCCGIFKLTLKDNNDEIYDEIKFKKGFVVKFSEGYNSEKGMIEFYALIREFNDEILAQDGKSVKSNKDSSATDTTSTSIGSGEGKDDGENEVVGSALVIDKKIEGIEEFSAIHQTLYMFYTEGNTKSDISFIPEQLDADLNKTLNTFKSLGYSLLSGYPKTENNVTTYKYYRSAQDAMKGSYIPKLKLNNTQKAPTVPVPNSSNQNLKRYKGIAENPMTGDIPLNVDSMVFIRVLYLNISNGAQFQGHAAIALVNNYNQGILYSMTGDYSKTSAAVNGGNIPAGVSTSIIPVKNRNGDFSQTTFNINEFLRTGIVPSVSTFERVVGEGHYDRYISMDITNEEGQKMFKRAEELRTDKNLQYNLYGYNCNDLAQDILSVAGKNFGPVGHSSIEEQLYWVFPNLSELVPLYNDARKDLTIPNAVYDYGVSIAKEKGWTVGQTGFSEPNTNDELLRELNPFK